MNKICNKCQLEKDETEFRLGSNAHKPPKSGIIKEWRKNTCMECERKRKLERFYNNHETNKLKARNYARTRTKEKRRQQWLKDKFGVNEEWYRKQLEEQKNVCKICGGTNKNKPLMVDHDHKSGLVRGLLCLHCNSLLGFSKDNITILQKAIVYLQNS
jgi:hypothetical protein